MSIFGHGITAREQSVIDLRDQGLSHEVIAARLGIATSYVSTISSRYPVTESNAWQNSAWLGSVALLAALQRHHPERCGGAT